MRLRHTDLQPSMPSPDCGECQGTAATRGCALGNAKLAFLPVFRMGRVELVFDSGENGSVLFNRPVKPRIGHELIPWKHRSSAIGKP